jgi:hypothetical protein
MSKKVIIIIIVVLLLSTALYIYYRSRRPRIRFTKIDWKNKCVDYEMTVSGETRRGKQCLESNMITEIRAKDGKHIFSIIPLFGPQRITFEVLREKGGVQTQVAGAEINFADKQYSETQLLQFGLM